MFTKNFFFVFSLAIVFIAELSIEIFAQSPCPNYNDLLDKGWAGTPRNQHQDSLKKANRDEFAVTDPSPFILKVNDYPPVKSFPIIPYSGCSGSTFYYFSFDTDNDYLPINFKMPRNQENIVKTFRIDQSGNYTSGCSASVYPPDVGQIGGVGPPDFVMKYDGTMHDVAWNPNLYPWGNFVQNIVTYNPQELSVVINGVGNLDFGNTSEYIADINGGSGKYGIYWDIRTLPSGNWTSVQSYYEPVNYYFIYGNNYYFYDSEYKYHLTMPDIDIELKVLVYDHETGLEVSATKVVTVNPEPVTFINHIETSENYGELILDENHSDPISSGDSRSLIFGNNYTIRTNELPFIVDWNSAGKTEKHHRWVFEFPPDANELNHWFLMDANTPLEMKSTFLSTQPASIKTLVDGVELSGLDIKFNDPWFYYEDTETNNWYQSDIFKTYTSPLEMYNNSPSSYGGVILNQRPEVEGIYYSVQSPLTQTKNLGGAIGTRTFYFQNWSTFGGVSLQQVGSSPPGYDQKAVVFTSAGATVNAKLKGQLMSNDQNGISSGSQRKLVRTDNGIYHVVYESMGHIWYTHSLTGNFNGQWRQEICLSDAVGNSGKNPAVDFEGNNVKIVFETVLNDEAYIYLFTFIPDVNGNYVYSESEEVLNYPLSYFGNAKPVIAYNDVVVFIAYRKNTSDGLYQMTKWNDAGNWFWGTEDTIPNTTLYSSNPTVCGLGDDIYLAWQHSLGIRYIFGGAQGTNWRYANYEIISTSSGYQNNYSPSMSLAKNGYPVVSWVGYNYTDPGGGGINKIEGESPTSKIVVRRASGSSWSSFFKAGYNAVITNNNSTSSALNEESIITWSEGTSPNFNSKWVRRVNGSYTDAHSLSHNGKQNQVSNGTTVDNIEGTVFTITQLPYMLSLVTTDFNQQFLGGGGINKVGDLIELSYGREGVIYKNGVEFLFNLGDIIVGDSVIKFIEQPDTILYSSAEELNSVVKTVPFFISPSTEFYFTDFYYVLNDSLADTALTAIDVVNFKVELVNNQSGQVVGTFDNVTYTKENLSGYTNISYNVDCSNITSGNYFLRLVTVVEGEADYHLGNVQNSSEELNKHNYQQINFSGTDIPVSYKLEQNYPNPFNPATTIRYQIPKDGIVTLKVYDLLGAEIATLVNEEKAAGKYLVNFDANRLASGVYIYRLQASDFISVKKMVLVK